MSLDVVKGGWTPDEDGRLLNAMKRYGTRWSLVAPMVRTRNSDQCSKRWSDTLNPAIDRTAWSAEADDLLLQAVREHGKMWKKIVQMYLPGRTGLAAKNRYNSITRPEGSSRGSSSCGSSRGRHTPESSPSPAFSDLVDLSPMFHPISLPDYSSMACTGCWPGSNQYASPHSTTQDPGFAGLTRSSTTSQLPPPTSSYEPIPHPCHSQSEGYYPADTAYSSCYQSPGQLASTLPENNPAFSDYSWLESLYALQPLQQEAQYPDTPFDVGCGSLTYPGTDCGQDACDSNNWVDFIARQGSSWDACFV
ncbi:Homeodomain-like protein [Mycena leptocephala]|nr:Homeodomain-like protein [Mycena leptocephala]